MTSVTPMVMKKRQDVVTDGGDADACCATRRRREDNYFLVPKVVNRCAMACEEMELFYAYLDAVEEAKRKAQPWECEVTVIPQGDEAVGCGCPRQRKARPRRQVRIFLRRAGMTELTTLTIAEARDGLKQKKFSAAELADAHLAAIEKARSLNAYVLETPERARAMAKAADARIAKGDAGPARRHPARHQGPVLHRGRAHDGVLAHPRQFRADLRSRP